jgi:hypothetical protein
LLGIAAAIYSGWPAVLTAACIGIHAVLLARRGAISKRLAIGVIAAPLAVLGILLTHLAEWGLDGRWDVLYSLIVARWEGQGASSESAREIAGTLWGHTLNNFTVPTLALIALAVAARVAARTGGLANAGAAPTGGLACGAATPIPSAVWIMTVPGLCYLTLVHQARIHHYWWFHCWPAAAYFGGRGAIILGEIAGRLGARAARVVVGAALGACVVCGVVSANKYFADITYLPQNVLFWNTLPEAIGRNTPVLLRQPFIKEQTYGTYRHWWWASPMSAYYMDRPYRQVTTFDDVGRFVREFEACPYLVEPSVFFAQDAELKKRLEAAGCRAVRIGEYAVYDLHPLLLGTPP